MLQKLAEVSLEEYVEILESTDVSETMDVDLGSVLISYGKSATGETVFLVNTTEGRYAVLSTLV